MVPAESPIPSPSGLLLPPLLAALGIVFAVLLALLALHLLLKRLGSRNAPRGPACLGVVVDSKVLDSLPVRVYDEDHKFLQRECCVCLSALEDGALVRVVPPCRHVFHCRCVDPWLVSRSSCPLCRSEVTLTDTFVVEVMFVGDGEI